MTTKLGDGIYAIKFVDKSCLEINARAEMDGMKVVLSKERPIPLQNSDYVLVLGIHHIKKVNRNQHGNTYAQIAIPPTDRIVTPQEKYNWLFGLLNNINPYDKSRKVKVTQLQRTKVLILDNLANVFINVPESVLDSPITIHYSNEDEKAKKYVIPPLRKERNEDGEFVAKDYVIFVPMFLPKSVFEEIQKEVISFTKRYIAATKPQEKQHILQQQLKVYAKYIPSKSLEMLALMDDYVNHVFEKLGVSRSIFVKEGYIKFNPVYTKDTKIIVTDKYSKHRKDAVNDYDKTRRIETLTRSEYEQKEADLAAEAKKETQQRNKFLKSIGKR